MPGLLQRLIELSQRTDLTVLGLMSGTSMDGLDVCLARICRSAAGIGGQLLVHRCYTYPETIRQMLLALPEADARTICRVNFDIARHWADLIADFTAENASSHGAPDIIGSHGQTIWHEHRHSTLQIGEAAVLAERFRVPVVADFRVRDVAAGGSGAPLVPIADYYLFHPFRRTIMALNIGGIANFSLLPVDAQSTADVIALDTGPGNCLIDLAVRRMTDNRLPYDEDGRIAASGCIRTDWLAAMLSHPYLSTEPPKSTGREIFGRDYLDELINRFAIRPAEYPDLIATLTRFTAEAIHGHYSNWLAPRYPLDEIVISGGGAANPVLRRHLHDLFPAIPIRKTDDYGIPSEAKEAFAFALLAALTVWGETGNIPRVTGAGHPTVLGKISM